MNISEHFTREEFDCHDGIQYPSEWITERLSLLCAELEILRKVWNKPIKILSGYRTPAYNTKIHGAPKSQHMLGKAGDCVVEGISPDIVRDKAVEMVKAGELKYIKGIGKYPGFTHLDIRNEKELITWNWQVSE